MTSTVKVNTITVASGCTMTLGESGKTVALATGASQTGFGRTGTVNWNTTKITADPGPAVSGVGYFTDTSGAAFNVTLPASPSAGDIVAVADYANTWDTKNLTIARNGSNIEGAAENLVCNQEGASITLVYVDATKGWITVNSGNSTAAFGNTFIVATGGTESTCGDCKIHTFTGPGTFTVSGISNCASNNVVSHLVVAGGGSGALSIGGGGGAGGYREVKSPLTSFTASPLDGYPTPSNRVTVTASAFPITVGAGGAGVAPPSPAGNPGNPSIFSTVTSAGGGRGGNNAPALAGPGGSGGGASGNVCPTGTGGTGNTPPVSPPQGNNGGNSGPYSGVYAAGGGGGAGAAGTNGSPSAPGGGPGGAGVTSSITGSAVQRAGGGGGSVWDNAGGTPGSGGAGGGGAGGDQPGTSQPGTANTGGGGGGGDTVPVTGSGGSGIVVIRYKYQ